jgi:3-deoxy-D-manno-octulosonate 8-phosphate phosphatase (KDO 8-P phosphatase)
MELSRMNSALEHRLQAIQMLVCDVDGTLTDGSVTLSYDGGELKTFNVHDGLGIALAIRNGLDVAFMTGRNSLMVERRAKELGVTTVLQGISNKRDAVDALAIVKELNLDAVAYIGDDINDLPAMERVGLVFAVQDASEFVCRKADCVLTKRGGHGAVREAIELILDAKFGMGTVVETYIAASQQKTSKPVGQ